MHYAQSRPVRSLVGDWLGASSFPFWLSGAASSGGLFSILFLSAELGLTPHTMPSTLVSIEPQ